MCQWFEGDEVESVTYISMIIPGVSRVGVVLIVMLQINTGTCKTFMSRYRGATPMEASTSVMYAYAIEAWRAWVFACV
jgi:hypothetical protein